MQGSTSNCLTQGNKKGCFGGIAAIRLAVKTHHQATPESLSSGCCSVLRPSCLRGTWAHLHWMCSCLWSSSSKGKGENSIGRKNNACIYFNSFDLYPSHKKNKKVLPVCCVTYSFAVIVVQRGILIVWPRQCREVLIVDGEILCLLS